ncbi:MAG: VOC family protein [Pseudomonadota bacterium]
MQFDIDHIIILHDDLSAAADAARRLGFITTPTGHHSREMGTVNTTLMFADKKTYVELLAIDQPTDRNAPMRAALAERGPHVFGIAFKGNAQEAHAHFKAHAIDGGAPFDFQRPVDVDGTATMARFTVAPIKSGALPGLYAFVCDQLTPQNVWIDSVLGHPNGARALRKLVGTAHNVPAVLPRWTAFAGDAVDGRAGGMRVTTSTCAIEVTEGGDLPFALSTVELAADLDAARACLEAANVPIVANNGSIEVPDTIGFGAKLRFVAA